MKKRYIALGAIGILSVAGVAGFVATSLVSKASAAVAETIAPALPPPERIEVSRQAMVKALEQKVEITSASMYLDKYVPGGVCGENAWQRFMYNNCVTMLVTAKVNAGFDWKAVTAQQITADHERVTVDLGSPKILDVVTIHDKTKVLDQDDGLLVSSDIGLQMRVLSKTESAFRADACRNGILRLAALSAKENVGEELQLLLKQAGDKRTVKIVYTVPSC